MASKTAQPEPPTEEVEYVLYILMRDDLASLNPGKAMAQAAHVGSQVAEHVGFLLHDKPLGKHYRTWASQAQGFGTTLTLAASWPEIEMAFKALELTLKATAAVHPQTALDIASGIIHDPTYPLKDGNFTHLIPLNTCAWMFGPRDILRRILQEYPLHL